MDYFSRHQNYTYLVLTICALLLGGCASTKLYTPVDYCTKPTVPDMARVILDRKPIVGGAYAFQIYDSGQVIADIGPGDRVCWDRYPGKASITSNGVKPLDFEAEAGHTYHLKIRDKFMNLGWFIELVDEQ